MVYLDSDQTNFYKNTFGEDLSHLLGQPLLAVMVRGPDALTKVESIVGHFNPDTARITNEKSITSYFGQDKDFNCTLKLNFNQKKKFEREMMFWFGGRASLASFRAEQKEPSMYVVAPPAIEKQIMLLSPMIRANMLPVLI